MLDGISDFRERNRLDISEMTEEQRKDLLLFYLNTLADIYGERAATLGKSQYPFDKQLVGESQQRKQEVLYLRALVQAVLEERIAKKMVDQLNQAQRFAAPPQPPPSQLIMQTDRVMLQEIARCLIELESRWQRRVSVPGKSMLIRSVQSGISALSQMVDFVGLGEGGDAQPK